MEQLMRCKFQIHGVEMIPDYQSQVKTPAGSWICTEHNVKVKMGAVWHGGSKEQEASENAVFGDATPHGTFEATIHNKAVARRLQELVGREVYIDFTLVPLPIATE